jgi:hypothetical protein
MENKVECNTPQMLAINIKIQLVENVNVMHTSASKIKHNRQPILLPRKHVWNRFGQSTYEQHRLIISRCNFCKQNNHSLMDYSFIDRDIRNVMINHFHIQTL